MVRGFKKTAFWVLVISLFSVMILSGCSNPDNTANHAESEDSTPASNTASTQAATPVAEKRHTISIAAYQLGPIEKEASMIKYWNEKFNVDIQVMDIDATKWNDILNLKFASGEIPDRLRIDVFNSLPKYVGQDILAEIPIDLLQKHAPTLYQKIEAEVPGAFKFGMVDGKLYGIPNFSPHAIYRGPVVYRGDWMKNLGVDKAPETLEDFEKLMYKFANEDPDQDGNKNTYGLSKNGLDAVFGAFGYLPNNWQERDGKLVYGAVQPEMKQALTLLNKWYKDKVLDPEFITGENTGGYWALSHAFINGKIGYTGMGAYYHWKPLLYEGDAASNNYVEMMKVNPAAAELFVHGLPPIGPTGKRGVNQANMLTGEFVAFGKQLEKDPEKMIKILEMLEYMNASFENFMVAYMGIEGKDWEYNEVGSAKHLGERTDKMAAGQGAHLVMNPMNLPEYYLGALYKPWVTWADKNQYNVGGIRSLLQGTLPSQAKVGTELLKIQDEAYISIITGDKPIDYFDEFVGKWQKAGGTQLEQEANDWYANMKK